MTYGLSGSASTGKTTLARQISDTMGIPFFETRTTELLAEIGLSGVDQLGIEARFRAQNHLLTRFWELSQTHPRPFVSDRTPLDYIGYMLTEVSMHNTSPELGKRIDEFVDRCMRVTELTYSDVFILRRLPAYDADPKRPPANLAYDRHFQLVIEGSAARMSHTPYYLVRTTDRRERLECLQDAIDASIKSMQAQQKEAVLC